MTGADFTIGDIPIGLVVNRWFSMKFERPEYPAVARYYERLSERPAYRATCETASPDAEMKTAPSGRRCRVGQVSLSE